MSKIYVILNEDNEMVTYFGASAQDISVYPNLTTVDSSSDIYKAYYDAMTNSGLSGGMIVPD